MTFETPHTVAIIGGSGEISEPFNSGLLERGIRLRILARHPERVCKRYPAATVVPGSMTNTDDVAGAMEGANAALLTTPISPRNDPRAEVDSARPTIEAARRAGLPHLIFISCIEIDHPTGVALLDAKKTIEEMLAESGIPWTSIRCGSYMEDVIDTRVGAIRAGHFVLPVKPDLPFHYTAQKDVPRLVCELLGRDLQLNGSVAFVTPETYTPRDAANIMTRYAGRRVRPTGRWLFCVLLLALPIFWLLRHRFSTIFHLILHFNREGYVARSRSIADLMPDFRMTSLEEHLHDLLAQPKPR
jgi:uncharacterized protein YbjT (DUF2867 family)